MYLTLRTLLAFIDNIYDSASRRMVEQRIQSQKSAVEALHRIVEVAKNADLGAPGEELNPNLTAAYLDHLLSDEENSRFEEIVFQSDIFLAEAVACHKILTVILSRPVTVSGDLRQKLYRIAPSGIAFPVKPEKSPCFPPSALPKASSETMPRTAAARHPATSLSEEHSEEYSETTSAVSSKTPYFTESLSTVSSPKREKFDRFSESEAVKETFQMKIPANQDLFIRPEEQHRIDDLFDHWEKRKRFNLWRVAVLSILLFAGVFILNMVMDQTEVSPLPVSVTAVDTSHLLDGPSHQEYFTQNKPVFDTSAAKTEENPEIQNGLQPAVSEDVPLLAHSADSILFYESPSEIDRHIISPPVTPPNPSANHGIVPPQEETAAVIPPFSPPSTALAALWSVPFPEAAATPSVPAAPPSEIVSFPVSETPHVTPLSPAAFSVEPVEPPEYSGVLPSSSTPMVSMQILPPGSTEQTISAETNSRNTPSPTSLSSPYSRIQVITHGTTPSVNEVMKRSLPPLTPITPAGPSSQSSSQGSEPVDENKTSFDRNSAISQVGFTAPTAASFTDIRTTILKLSEENIAFTARDEHSIWERAVNEKSLQSDEFLLVPAPFRAVIRTGGGLKLTVFGDTRLRFLQDGTGMMFDYGTIQILTEEVIGFPVTYRIKTPQGSGTFLFSGPNSCVMLRSTDGTPPEYSPNLVVRPGTHGTVLWASDLHQESQFAIQRDAKITLNSTSPHEPVFLEGDVIKETMPVSIPDITAQNLCRKMKTSPTLESALEEFLSDTSPDVRYWGCRWCAELGRVDLPVKHLRREPAGSPRQTRLADYIHEIKSRDPKTAQRMELAEKHFAGTND